MAFKFYDPRPPEVINPAEVIIGQRWMTLTSEAMALLKNPEFITVAIDEENHLLGFKATTESNPMNIPIKIIKEQGRLSIPEFIALHKLDGSFLLTWDKGMKMAIANIVDQ